jgi:hypothetical protein
MNAEQFVYWLNGYLELSGAQELNAAQVKSVREHLALVLHKVTPPLENPKPTYFGGGVKCEVCQNWCSNEGGVCNRCKLSTTTSGAPPVIPPAPPGRPSWAPTWLGQKCEICKGACSSEGGACNKCKQVTVFSSSVYFPRNQIDPFSSPEPEPTGHCDGCGKERKHSELSAVSTDNLAGVVMCDECRQPKRPRGLNILEAPIVDVPCVLTC